MYIKQIKGENKMLILLILAVCIIGYLLYLIEKNDRNYLTTRSEFILLIKKLENENYKLRKELLYFDISIEENGV